MNRMLLSLAGVGAVLLVATAFAEEAEFKQVSCLDLKLFFTDVEAAVSRDCSVVRPVSRRICGSPDLPVAVLRELLKGVTDKEKSAGLTSSFEPSVSLHQPGTKPLRKYFKGVTVANEVATIDFEGGAMAYLNGAACHQASVKSTIERTLLQFPQIRKVEYSIDGKVITDWDA